jgi:hypothetical protein
MDQREVRAAWEKFVEHGALSADLRSAVAASWQRSKNHKVTIDRAEAPLVADAELLCATIPKRPTVPTNKWTNSPQRLSPAKAFSRDLSRQLQNAKSDARRMHSLLRRRTPELKLGESARELCASPQRPP